MSKLLTTLVAIAFAAAASLPVAQAAEKGAAPAMKDEKAKKKSDAKKAPAKPKGDAKKTTKKKAEEKK
jgi:hypothetical protein